MLSMLPYSETNETISTNHGGATTVQKERRIRVWKWDKHVINKGLLWIHICTWPWENNVFETVDKKNVLEFTFYCGSRRAWASSIHTIQEISTPTACHSCYLEIWHGKFEKKKTSYNTEVKRLKARRRSWVKYWLAISYILWW